MTAALSHNAYTDAVLSGVARSSGDIALQARAMHPSEMFWRQMKHQEFDVSEMSLSSLLILRDRGDDTWAGLPIFTSRRFFHSHVLLRRDLVVDGPADLAGRRIGVPEYQQTAAVWARGVLHDQFGLRPETIHWVMERPADVSHAGLTGFTPPPGLRLSTAPEGVSLAELLAAGELDGLLVHLAGRRNLIDGGDGGVDIAAHTRPLFADRLGETARYWAATGIHPANHCVVIRRSLVDTDPALPKAVFSAFADAKRRALRARREFLDVAAEQGALDAATRRSLEADPMPYGTADPRMLETLARYACEQGLTSRPVPIADLFEPGL